MMKFPKPLDGHAKQLTQALEEVAVFGEWPEASNLREADQPQAIGRVIVKAMRKELVNARIAYLFRESWKAGSDRIRLAKAQRAGGPLKFLGNVDFVLVFNWMAWRQLLPLQRVALVDHELMYCGIDDRGAYEIHLHDVEEFGEIVRRWGLWKSDLRLFDKDIKAASPIDLFEALDTQAPPAEPAEEPKPEEKAQRHLSLKR